MTAMWDMDDGGSGRLATAHQDSGDSAVATALPVHSKPRARREERADDTAQSLQATRERVDARLDALLPAPDAGVAAAMRAGALSPGKRIRPLMMLALAADLGCDKAAVLDLACAIEMLHAASLILDDLPCMDDAELRRGRPTLHRQFGEDVATLAAIGLLTQAYRTVAQAPGLNASARVQATLLLSDAVGLAGLIGGQYQDLREGSAPRSPDRIALTNHLKTGALFDAAFGLCAACADADDAVRGRLSALAAELGQAFQLLDDLHDCALISIDAKDVGRDADKSTLVQALGQTETLARLRAHVGEIERHAEALGARRLGDGLVRLFASALALQPSPVSAA